MRLINTRTLALEEFFGDGIPPYAILSHTWQDEEVSFQDWADQSSASQKKGYKKILGACQLAKERRHDHLWVDTNCIDKSSSSELSEAINSMFKWYQFSQVCFVYLADVSSPEVQPLESGFSEGFVKSRWFTRGWTLQELLAPAQVEFYSEDWSFLGTKGTLRAAISLITRIDVQYLWSKHIGDVYFGNPTGVIARSIEHAVPLHKASVSKRLSWVSDRTTTRLEDIAYCMLGIFGLNMPLLYGEGSKAFTRLQEEIMKVSDDHSLFCWSWTTPQNRGSFLSESHSVFKNTAQFAPKQEDKRPAPYTFTNAGLSIRLPIFHGWQSSFIGVLNVESVAKGKLFGIPMDGDLKTGRLSRKPFPPEPIPLCDSISVEQYDIFVSEKYSSQSVSRASGGSPLSNLPYRGIRAGEHAVLLTFEAQGMVLDIRTYPANRFDPRQNSISIYLVEGASDYDSRQLTHRSSYHQRHMYEGVLIQLQLQPEVFETFMVAAWWDSESIFLHEKRDENMRRTPWKRRCWPVSRDDAKSITAKDWFHMTMQDPNCEELLHAQSLKASVSLAKDYLQLGSGAGAISHMHVSHSKP